MRAGSACASHQTLSAEAASVLKHSLSLARRRGHAQVTPLHVAATLLTSRASLLRRACLRSQPHHHHPLQCRALELCFNVALNRLPATPTPLLSAQPSLSNALVAALKRAQAHQRRGCVEMQQPLVAVKVELEQLLMSILDDPSVSRVMREAGFSSAAVKSNLEDAANINSVFQCYNSNSGGIYSTPNSPPPSETLNPGSTFWQSHLLSYASSEDVKVVMEVVLRNKNTRKNTVVVGDSLSAAENVVSEIMRRVERGDVSEGLKSAHFVKLELPSVPIKFMSREEVEMNIGDLKKKVESFVGSSSSSGVIIYTGDLKWTVDDDEEGDGAYRPADHLVAEMGKLLSWYNNHSDSSRMSRVWLMGIANYQTYMKCQMKQPPLDLQWALQAVSVPTAGLGLSLNATSGQHSRINLPSQDSEKRPPTFEQEALTCCAECKSNYEKECRSLSSQSTNNGTENGGSPHLPFWLKPHSIDTLVKDELVQLRRKYNKLCQSLHSNQSYLGRDYNYPSSNSCWPTKKTISTDCETISFASNYPPVKTSRTASSLPRFRRQPSCHIDFSFNSESSKYQTMAELNLDSLKGTDDKEVKITLALGNLSYNDQKASLDDDSNYAGLVKLFQENVPWQSEKVPSILEALLADHSKANGREDFILFKGNDEVGKSRFAVGIAEFVFGSSDFLFCMNMRKGSGSLEMMEKALKDHEKLVVLVEDVDYADCEFFTKFLKEGYERESGRVIFILTMDEENKYGTVLKKEKPGSVIRMKLVVDHGNNLDHRKRKADWDLPVIKNNSHRNNNETKQVISPNTLDLNIEADDQEEVKPNGHLRFLEKIKKRFVLNMGSDQEAREKEMFSHKLKRAFEEVFNGGRNNILSSFVVEEKVLEEVLRGSGLYLNSLFEQWVEEVFHASLRMIDSGGEGERVSIRLCSEERCPDQENGFMGTRLPKSIQLSLAC